MKKNRLACVALLLLFLSGCISFSASRRLQPYSEKTLLEGDNSKILVIYIKGIISDTVVSNPIIPSQEKLPLSAQIREQLDMAAKDKQIKAIILNIDSPGGEVTTCDIIHHEIMKYKKQNNVTITVLMGSMAASGGYYLAVTGDTIVAHPTTVTGSIGVLITKMSLKGLFEKVGIQDETVKSGENKTMGSMFKDMTPAERKLFQQIVDSMYERFLSVILQTRKNITIAELRKVADGRVMIASDALKHGLIDKIGYFDDAIEVSKKAAALDNPKVVTYVRPGSYRPNIYAGAQIRNEGTINILSIEAEQFSAKYGTKFMYLWTQ